LAYAYEHLWVLSILGTLSKADPTDLAVVDSVVLDDVVLDVAAGGGAIWVAGPRTLYAFDPATLSLITSTEIPGNWYGQIRGLTGDDRLLVAVLTEADRVVVVDAVTGQRIAIYELPTPTDAALDNGILWVVSRDGSIYRIETAELRD
jgi:DNA-binding beta-propeller fold protein YncE